MRFDRCKTARDGAVTLGLMARRLGGLALIGGMTLGCGAGGTAPATNPAPAQPAAAAAPTAAPAGPSADALAEANTIFATRCTPCHGPQGRGDGPASKGLTPPPRNFTDAKWQASVTDEHIETIVKYGGAAVGKSPAMPSNPDLLARPEVVQGLRAYVRSLAQK